MGSARCRRGEPESADDFYHCQIVEGDLARNSGSAAGAYQIAGVPSGTNRTSAKVNIRICSR
jgi:hydroxypyruvate isomerase